MSRREDQHQIDTSTIIQLSAVKKCITSDCLFNGLVQIPAPISINRTDFGLNVRTRIEFGCTSDKHRFQFQLLIHYEKKTYWWTIFRKKVWRYTGRAQDIWDGLVRYEWNSKEVHGIHARYENNKVVNWVKCEQNSGKTCTLCSCEMKSRDSLSFSKHPRARFALDSFNMSTLSLGCSLQIKSH